MAFPPIKNNIHLVHTLNMVKENANCMSNTLTAPSPVVRLRTKKDLIISWTHDFPYHPIQFPEGEYSHRHAWQQAELSTFAKMWEDLMEHQCCQENYKYKTYQ